MLNRIPIRTVATVAVSCALAVPVGAYLWHQSDAMAHASASVASTTRHSVTAPSTPPTRNEWTMDDLSDEDVSYILANVVPFYRVDAPSWCNEDMPCWSGSNADGRTDRQVLASLRCDSARGSYSYAEQGTTAQQDQAYGLLDAVCAR